MSDEIDLRTWLEQWTQPELATLARLWSLPASASDQPGDLAIAMLEPERARWVVDSLDSSVRAALELIQSYGGHIAAAVLEREFGAIRNAGTYANPRAFLMSLSAPPSPTERLFWYGLIQPLRHGTNHSYIIPIDLRDVLPPVALRSGRIVVAPAEPPATEIAGTPDSFERNLLVLLTLAQQDQLEVVPNGALNKASLLRLVRLFDPKATLSGVRNEDQLPYIQFMRQVAEGSGLVRSGADAQLRPTKTALSWFSLPQFERTQALLEGWINGSFDELATFARLKFQRGYGRDVPRARRALLRMIAQLSSNTWLKIDDLVAAVKATEPDFARPNGVYDSWGIIDDFRRSYDGFAAWEAVEGQQVRYVIACSLHWLGLLDIGWRGEEPESFRINAFGAALLQEAEPPALPADEPLIVQPNFDVLVSSHASLYNQFQIRRIAEVTRDDSVSVYRLNQKSLQAALARGIAIDDIERFLEQASGRALPQNVAATLRDWGNNYGQVAVRRAVLLETSDAALFEQISRDKRLRFPKVERLSEYVAVLRDGDVPQLLERLRKAGYGVAGDVPNDAPLSERDLTVLFAALEFYATASDQLGLEHEASQAMRRRVAKLLSEKQLNRAYQTSHAATERLKQRIKS